MLTLSREQLIAHLPKKGKVVEIGVDKGDFSKVILENDNPQNLILVDPWIEMLDVNNKEETHQAKYQTVKDYFADDDRVEIIKKSSKEAADQIDDNSMDWIYIDGDHKYQGCLEDLRIYKDKVKDDGYICGHDWTTKTKKGFGVNQAVEEFLSETGFLMCGLTSETNFKSYVIAKNNESRERFYANIR